MFNLTIFFIHEHLLFSLFSLSLCLIELKLVLFFSLSFPSLPDVDFFPLFLLRPCLLLSSSSYNNINYIYIYIYIFTTLLIAKVTLYHFYHYYINLTHKKNNNEMRCVEEVLIRVLFSFALLSLSSQFSAFMLLFNQQKRWRAWFFQVYKRLFFARLLKYSY